MIPVRVAQCELEGFFKPLVYIDFLESPPLERQERRELLIEKLLDGVKLDRRKPESEPPLPDFNPESTDTNVVAAKAGVGDETSAVATKRDQAEV